MRRVQTHPRHTRDSHRSSSRLRSARYDSAAPPFYVRPSPPSPHESAYSHGPALWQNARNVRPRHHTSAGLYYCREVYGRGDKSSSMRRTGERADSAGHSRSPNEALNYCHEIVRKTKKTNDGTWGGVSQPLPLAAPPTVDGSIAFVAPLVDIFCSQELPKRKLSKRTRVPQGKRADVFYNRFFLGEKILE